MNQPAELQIASELEPGERLLRSGQPGQGVRLRATDAFLVPFLSMTERADGSGDIVLGTAPPMMSWFAGSGWPGMSSQIPPSLEAVPTVRDVHAMIRRGQLSAA